VKTVIERRAVNSFTDCSRLDPQQSDAIIACVSFLYHERRDVLRQLERAVQARDLARFLPRDAMHKHGLQLPK